MMQKISGPLQTSQPLYGVAATRTMEASAAANLAPHTLMKRAGLAVAQLGLALAPHAQTIWIACGPGNNGGDGFEAALHLHQWGKKVVVTWSGLGPGKNSLPPDAETSRNRAMAAGVPIAQEPPADFDFCIDALLGIGSALNDSRPASALMVQWLDTMRRSGKPMLCVDLPTGLDADTGKSNQSNRTFATESIANNVRCTSGRSQFDQKNTAKVSTLSLLTLKPGLFTADGRDLAGEVWFDDLGTSVEAAKLGLTSAATEPPAISAWRLAADRAAARPRSAANHASHKGSFGDVAIIGGESTAASHMAGAALLAGRAALHTGAGRVFVAMLADTGASTLTVDIAQPELMFRHVDALDFRQQVVVCGCGGGSAVRAVLPRVLSTAKRLVLDADALNAIAADPQLQTLLKARHTRGYHTVLTPHPLEAARLAGVPTAEVQADRLAFAARLAQQFGAAVVLKGSGSIIAAPGQTSCINSSGNALLATAGTGDVLAGMVGAFLANGLGAFEAACGAVYEHGRLADQWATEKPERPLTASQLAILN